MTNHPRPDRNDDNDAWSWKWRTKKKLKQKMSQISIDCCAVDASGKIHLCSHFVELMLTKWYAVNSHGIAESRFETDNVRMKKILLIFSKRSHGRKHNGPCGTQCVYYTYTPYWYSQTNNNKFKFRSAMKKKRKIYEWIKSSFLFRFNVSHKLHES